MKRFAFLSLALLALTTNAHARPIYANFYLAPNGNDAWSGKLISPNKAGTDGPFATLPHAIEAARKVNRNVQNFAGINLTLRGGTYSLSETVTLTEKDAFVNLRSYPNETARLTGGKEITGWKPVTDKAVLSRMDATCRSKVFSADLKANGITETGAIVANGWNKSNIAGPSELVFGDKPMTIARWPNTGYAQIADVPKEGGNLHFQYEGERPSRWKNAEDAWVFGYWQFDWADSYVKLKSVDSAKHTLETSGIEDEFGSKKRQRWFALNLLEELDAPGEYFIDRKANVIYFWPPSPLENSKTSLSLLDKPLISLNHTTAVSVQGLTLEGTRGEGIHIEGGAHNLIAGCTFRNMGLMGVRIAGGKENRVQSCDLYDMGQGGITLDGGDRITLEEGGSVAENNLIHDYSKWVRCYRPAIGVNGVGQKVLNNLIYDGPHTAILLSGNGHSVLRNEVHHVCKDTGDVGAFYMGRDWTMRGNKIAGNYFHHLGGFKGEGFTDAMGVYLDDAASGSTV
ncbi:MAG: right-handed parallel beta-helix repeat-containing protein, partial [Chthonomonadaceae bacterium]|nr:right-handed parallel beta-helix repeat-containing protein [Chthonomonadaceae bacterium]